MTETKQGEPEPVRDVDVEWDKIFVRHNEAYERFLEIEEQRFWEALGVAAPEGKERNDDQTA